MTMISTNPQVDLYFRKAKKWQEELRCLRGIVLGCGLTEELKWRQPCYTIPEGNVIILHGLKESCAIAFIKGTLLKDAGKILVAPGPNSRSTRWIKFTSVAEITALGSTLRAYIHEAMEVERAGLKVKPLKKSELVLPEELKGKFKQVSGLKTAFGTLTPGRQRAYVIHFSAPKQSKTRESRVEKCAPRILDGKGLNDR